MNRATRIGLTVLLSVLAVVLVAVLVMPTGCADVGGVPSWERCTTMLGTPAFSVEDFGLDNTFDIVLPLLAGVLAGVGSWYALGSLGQDD